MLHLCAFCCLDLLPLGTSSDVHVPPIQARGFFVVESGQQVAGSFSGARGPNRQPLHPPPGFSPISWPAYSTATIGKVLETGVFFRMHIELTVCTRSIHLLPEPSLPHSSAPSATSAQTIYLSPQFSRLLSEHPSPPPPTSPRSLACTRTLARQGIVLTIASRILAAPTTTHRPAAKGAQKTSLRVLPLCFSASGVLRPGRTSPLCPSFFSSFLPCSFRPPCALVAPVQPEGRKNILFF